MVQFNNEPVVTPEQPEKNDELSSSSGIGETA